MKLENQVFNIEQVQELQELGFDVRKYATSAVIEAKDGNHYIVDRRLLSINMGFMETEVIEYFETLSIGDIMDILPNVIKTTRFSYMIGIANPSVYYIDREISKGVYFFEKNFFIDNLFEALKWCIKNKHIQCQ